MPTSFTLENQQIDDKKIVYIYALRDPRTDEIRYVGKTIDMDWRLRCHKMCRAANKHLNSWIKILLNLGLEPKMEIIKETTPEEWAKDELLWIKEMKAKGCDLINIREGGEGPTGWTQLSEETKRKISLANKGKVRSLETRKKLSELNKGKYLGRKMLPEWIAKRIESRFARHPRAIKGYQLCLFNTGHLNHKWSDEQRNKFSSSRKGKKYNVGEKCYNAKLKKCEAEEIFRLSNSGVVSNLMLSKMFMVDQSVISKIKTGANWSFALNN
jgi:hypothetical protein